MKALSGIDWLAIVLTVIGGVNWGLVGVFGDKGNVVEMILGGVPTVEAIVYVVVGLAALWLIYTASKMAGGGSGASAGGGQSMGGGQMGGQQQGM